MTAGREINDTRLPQDCLTELYLCMGPGGNRQSHPFGGTAGSILLTPGHKKNPKP